jgi:hypothetical protein
MSSQGAPGGGAKKEALKQKIKSETREYLLIAAYLACFFLALTSYRKLVMAEYHIGYFEYGWALLQAMILSKVILIGEALHIGTRFRTAPLIVSTLWKSIVFALFAAVLVMCEHLIHALLHHEPVAGVFELSGGRGYEILARFQLMLVAFVPFFAFQEAADALGAGSVFALFFHRRPAGKGGDPH